MKQQLPTPKSFVVAVSFFDRFEHFDRQSIWCYILGTIRWFLPKKLMKKRQKRDVSEQSSRDRVTLLSPAPRIQLTPLAETKIWDIVQNCKYEAGWLGTVRSIPTGYLIEDIYCLPQVVSGVFNSINPDGLKTLYRKLLDQGASGFDKLERLYFWGHSHVNMSEWPSSIDRKTMIEVFGPSQRPVVIMGIFNKQGNAWFSVYEFVNGIIHDRVVLERPVFQDDSLLEEVDTELEGLEF